MSRSSGRAKILIIDAAERLPRVASVLRDAGYLDVHCVVDIATVEQVRSVDPELIVVGVGVASAQPQLVRAWRATNASVPPLVAFVAEHIDAAEILAQVDHLLQHHALHVDIARANRILEDQLSSHLIELRRSHAEMLVRLARAAEYRDDQTGAHTWRVGYMSRMIAAELELPERFVALIGLAARLHDVGKIGIPDSVLLKPGRLDADETRIMRAHTTIGARLLSGGSSELLSMAERIAVSHHERFDGSGYPFGLSGETIPLEGRIVAVADVFDALTHSRSYKDAWEPEQAIAEIHSQRGRGFEDRAVDAFLALWRSGEISRIQLAADDEAEIARQVAVAQLTDAAHPVS